MYFRGLVFVLWPEHIIAVAYCIDFRGLIFLFWALWKKKRTKMSRYTVLYFEC